MSATFRAGIGIIILNDEGKVVALERSRPAGAWQMPQGGIEGDEGLHDTLWRELWEETGLTTEQVQIVRQSPEWLGYELPLEDRKPKTGRGQVHKWFLLRPVVTELPIDLNVSNDPDPEFIAWRWMVLAELASQVVSFRQPVYRRLIDWVAED